MIRPLVLYPDARLSKPSRDVRPDEFGSEWLYGLAQDLIDTVTHYRGLGLAGVQVGELVRVFAYAAEAHPNPDGTMRVRLGVACNARILETRGDGERMNEGCLSFPGATALIGAPATARVAFTSLEGEEQDQVLDGLEARAFLHEEAHTRGRTILGRLGTLARRNFLHDMRKAAKRAA